MSLRNRFPVSAVALALAASLAPQASASGFQLREQSPSAQGNAFAGVTAKGSDISTMFFNPATMTAFDGFQFVVGGSFVAPKAELSGAKASRATYTGSLAGLAAFDETTITGSATHGDAANDALLPALYALWSVTKDFKLGLSINAPFGLVTEYDADFIGRYHALKSDLKTVDIALNAAYRVHPKFSVGASLVYRTVEAELSNAVDMGQITFLGLAQAGNSAYTSFAPSNTAAPYDGKATIKGDTAVTGYKLGITYQPTETLTLGLSYHGSTKPKVEGTVDYEYPSISSPALAGAMQAVLTSPTVRLVDGNATAEVELPDTTSLGISWTLSPAFTLGFEASRTGWSSFKELRVKFASGQADSVTEENWKDTWYFSLGMDWRLSEALTLRAGVATDQGAVEDAYRTPRIPDGDRTWLSAGLGYAFSKSFAIDAAYTHILVKDGTLGLSAGAYGSPDFFRGNLSGTYQNSIDILAVSARFSF